jgi:hypothetical protein
MSVFSTRLNIVKEYLEILMMRQEKERNEKLAKEKDDRDRKEAKRLADEARAREATRETTERNDREKDQVGTLFSACLFLIPSPQAIKSFEDLGKKGHVKMSNINVEELRSLDLETIEKKKADLLAKERKELDSKVSCFGLSLRARPLHIILHPMVGWCLGPGTTLGYHQSLQREAQA